MMKLMLTFVEWKYSSYNTAFNRDLVRSIQFSKWKAESQWIFTQWINQTLWSGELGCGEVIMRKCQVPHLLAAFNRFRKFESDTCFFSSCEIDITYSAEHLSFPSLKPIPPQPPTFVSPRSPPPHPARCLSYKKRGRAATARFSGLYSSTQTNDPVPAEEFVCYSINYILWHKFGKMLMRDEGELLTLAWGQTVFYFLFDNACVFLC